MTKQLVYKGSVKNLWAVDKNTLEFEFTNSYSVFDWGKMPDELPGKGQALASIGAFFFIELSKPESWIGLEECSWVLSLRGEFRDTVIQELALLQKNGLQSHFLSRSAPHCFLVKQVHVMEPKQGQCYGQMLYSYNPEVKKSSKRLLPIEVVFRFGLPQGSSLIERLTLQYAKQLGFVAVPQQGTLLESPIIEFFSKLEDLDRFLTWEEALNYSYLEIDIFKKIISQSLCISIWLAKSFEKLKLELWDGKLEWALVDGELALVDSIGPDELRILDRRSGVQISKEFLRFFYRKTKWFETMKKIKKEAERCPNIDWRKVVLDKGGPPPPLNVEYLEVAKILYPSLAFALTGENPEDVGLLLPEVLERIRVCTRQYVKS